MATQEHSFLRPDGRVLTVRTTTGEGTTRVELVEEPAAPPQSIDTGSDE